MRKFASYVVSAALGLASLSAQQPPGDPVTGLPYFKNIHSTVIQKAQEKSVLQSFFDMDLLPIVYGDKMNLQNIKYVVNSKGDGDVGLVECNNDDLKLAYNVSTWSAIARKSLKGINITHPNLNSNIQFFYSQSSVDTNISLDFWTFSSWTLEGIVNGEEFVVNYKVDNRKTLSGVGHLGKKKITVAYEYERDTDLFAKRRRTVIGDQTYITEFESKNGAYLSYVVTKQ